MVDITFKDAWSQVGYLDHQPFRLLVNEIIPTPAETEISTALIKRITDTPQQPVKIWWEKIKLYFWLFSSSNRLKFIEAIDKTNSVAIKALADLEDSKAVYETTRKYKAQKSVCDAETSQWKDRVTTYGSQSFFKDFRLYKYAYTKFFKDYKEKSAANSKKLEDIGTDLAKYGITATKIDLEAELAKQKQKTEDSKKYLQTLSQGLFSHKGGAAIRAALQEKPTKEVLLDDISKLIHPDMKEVWELLFNKFEAKLGGDVIKAWDCDPNGNFTLTLNKPLRMWVPSTDENGIEDPVGGVVLMLGNDNLEVKGKLVSKGNGTGTMKFEDGFYCFVEKVLPVLGRKRVQPNIFTLDYKNKDDVTFGAGITLPVIGKIEQGRKKSIDNLKTNWTQNGEIFVNGHDKAALNAKLDEKLKKT